MRTLKCLRCGARMNFAMQQKFQMGEAGFLSGDWPHILAGALELEVWFCPDCGKKINVFGKSHVDEVANEFGLPVLARLPINPAVAEAFDAGLMETVDTVHLAEAVAAVENA